MKDANQSERGTIKQTAQALPHHHKMIKILALLAVSVFAGQPLVEKTSQPLVEKHHPFQIKSDPDPEHHAELKVTPEYVEAKKQYEHKEKGKYVKQDRYVAFTHGGDVKAIENVARKFLGDKAVHEHFEDDLKGILHKPAIKQ